MYSSLLFTPGVIHVGTEHTYRERPLSFLLYVNALLLILTELFLYLTPSATCRCAPLSPPSPLKLPQPCIPFDAKRPLNCSQNLYAVLCGESASSSNIHSDQTSPRILMDAAAVHFVDGSRCVKLGQTEAGETVCELFYGTGCRNGYRAGGRVCYVISLQYVMDTARCFIFMKVTGVGYHALSHYRGDCKHCYRGRPEVCVEVHG